MGRPDSLAQNLGAAGELDRDRRASPDLQRYDLAALYLKRDRVALEIARHPARHPEFAVLSGYRKQLD